MMKNMAQVHMTEAEVSANFASVLTKIEQGDVIVVDRNGHPLAVIRPAQDEPRTLSEMIALAMSREQERGHAITLDEDYAAEVEQVVRDRKPWVPNAWE